MKLPDLELFHKLKCQLDERIENTPNSQTDLRRAAINHMRRTITRTEQTLERAISCAIDDFYYINEVLDAECDKAAPGGSDD